MAFFSLLSACKQYPVQDPIPPDPLVRKWNTGNFIASTTGDTASIWNAFKTRLAARPEWDGVLLRYSWPQLERNQGEYAWTVNGSPRGLLDIDQKINELQTPLKSRKLILFVAMKTFGGTTVDSVPAYMKTSSYGDPNKLATYPTGQYSYGSVNGGQGGNIPVMWVPAVRARWVALLNAIAERYDNTAIGENFECVMISELAVSKPLVLGGSPWPEESSWYTTYRDAMVNQVRPNFQRTNMIQWINSPRSFTAQIVPAFVNAKIGLGMTDACFRDKGFWFNPTDHPTTPPGNIYHLTQNKGNVAISCHASNQALDGSVANSQQVAEAATGFDEYTAVTGFTTWPAYDAALRDSGGGTPYQTKQYIHDKCVDYLGANYMLWAHSTQTDVGGGGTKAQTVDAWIGNAANDRAVITTRPAGW